MSEKGVRERKILKMKTKKGDKDIKNHSSYVKCSTIVFLAMMWYFIK